MSFVFIDWLIVGAFFAILLAIPFVIAKRDDGKKERYFNGGGSMPWWLIGISMTAAMIEYNAKENFGSAAAYGVSDDAAKKPGEVSWYQRCRTQVQSDDGLKLRLLLTVAKHSDGLHAWYRKKVIV